MHLRPLAFENYRNLRAGHLVFVETLGFTTFEGRTQFGPIGQERAELISASTKLVEERDSKGELTGTFRLRPDVVVYRKFTCTNDLSSVEVENGYHYTVIGNGAFRILEIEE